MNENGGGLLREVARQVERRYPSGARIVVAVSGGPDSLALLHALNALKGGLGLDLRAAHLDHGLRAEAGRADAEFVRAFAESIGVPASVGRADAEAFRRERRLSLEDAARRLRYEFLSEVALESDADAVALAHTADDQAETVLMRILRGTGLDGLGAMSPFASAVWGGRRVNLFRPLLEIGKVETLAYCADNALNPRIDETNASADMTRNRVRVELLPAMRSYNPAVALALNRLSRAARLDMSFIRENAEMAADGVMSRGADGVVSLDRSAFAALHPAIRRHVLRFAVQTAAGDRADLSESHVEDMLAIMSGPAGKGVDLPRGARFETDYRHARIVVSNDADEIPALPPDPVPISPRGETLAGGWRVFVENSDEDALARARRESPDGARLSETFSAAALGDGMRVRARAPADRFQPLGMESDKNLADFMIDARVPRRLRDRIPLLESGGRIAWVVGWRMAEWAKATPGARRLVRISFRRTDG